MSGMFDGVAGLVSDTLGGSVAWISPDHGEISVQSMFRRRPVESFGPQGEPVLAMMAVWQVPTGRLPRQPRKGDRIRTSDGATYLITAVQPSGSPAADRLITCELEAQT